MRPAVLFFFVLLASCLFPASVGEFSPDPVVLLYATPGVPSETLPNLLRERHLRVKEIPFWGAEEYRVVTTLSYEDLPQGGCRITITWDNLFRSDYRPVVDTGWYQTDLRRKQCNTAVQKSLEALAEKISVAIHQHWSAYQVERTNWIRSLKGERFA